MSVIAYAVAPDLVLTLELHCPLSPEHHWSGCVLEEADNLGLITSITYGPLSPAGSALCVQSQE